MSSGHGSGGHGRRPRRQEEEEHENHERWAVSYADMMTVLVGLFIVMYAISSVDQVKFEQLRDSLAVGFGNRAPSQLPGGDGVLLGVKDFSITPDLRSDAGIEDDPLLSPPVEVTEDERERQVAASEYDRLVGVAGQISSALEAKGMEDRVRFRMTERGLVVGLVADDVFFGPDTATMTATAQEVVDITGRVLATVPEQISVEGHANVLPTRRYATNWELSSDRATQVLRRLVKAGVPPGSVAAVGFGDARPLDRADTPEALDTNRRVDLVVLSTAPESVRALLPDLAAQE